MTTPPPIPALLRNHTISRWELHVGTVQLFLVGPGEDGWLACSEPCYHGPVGTPEEIAIGRRAVEILCREHRSGTDLLTLRAVLVRAGIEIARGVSSPPEPKVLEMEIVADPVMAWKCQACGDVFNGPTNRPPRDGCPSCGSRQVFDINATPITRHLPPPRPKLPPAHEPRPRRAPVEPAADAILAVLRGVADAAGVNVKDFTGDSRTREICWARHLAIATLHAEFPGLVYEQLGEIFHRHHKAICNALEQHARLLAHDRDYQKLHARFQEQFLTATA